MKKLNLEVIESNYNKIEDISNSCASLMQKIGQLQVDLFNNPDAKLEKFLGTINSALHDVHEQLVEVTHTYNEEKLIPAKGQEAFNSAEEELSEETN
ncbi:hypothetical protein SLW70_11400 [Flavobacterium sp. NG2]|uniref:hypothetical protein n=1 Tax=Flavobacterium sp. NG2 TaxID=3097547 RepID=UPI002A82C915|nr:hypothetical protein [Flavobacterium sp. NG2]WPR70538.1 hypothetical protein SLW70_11400 [Flavobacterium sp. NG2]